MSSKTGLISIQNKFGWGVIIVGFLLCISIYVVRADGLPKDYYQDNLYYHLYEDGHASVYNYESAAGGPAGIQTSWEYIDKKSKKIEVPASLEVAGVEYEVTEIEEETFHYMKQVPSIILPDTVLKIGDWGLPCESVLGELTIPSHLEYMGCQDLALSKGITIREGGDVVTKGNYLLGQKRSNLLLYLGPVYGRDLVLPESITRIQRGAFQHCPKEESGHGKARIWIPQGVSCIEKGTFSDCTWLSTIIVHDHEIVIEDGALTDNQKVIYLDQGACNPIDYRMPENQVRIGDILYGLSNGGIATVIDFFSSFATYADVEIPIKITSKGRQYYVGRIGEGAFSYNTFQSLTMPNSIFSICKNAFKDTSIRPDGKLILSANIRYVGKNAFHFELPVEQVSMRKRGSRADGMIMENGMLFSADKSTLVAAIGDFRDLHIPEGVNYIRPDAFYSFSYNEGALRVYQRIWLPSTINHIETGTFQHLPHLKSLIFCGDNELTIDAYAWSNGQKRGHGGLWNVFFKGSKPPVITGKQNPVRRIYVNKDTAKAYENALAGKVDYWNLYER